MKRNPAFRLMVLLACFAATMLAGVANPPAKPAKSAISDAALEQTIKARFAKSKISANHFTVHVQNGVATIEGSTDVIQHKGTATRIARSCGAKVVNKIQISEAAREKAAAKLASRKSGGAPMKKSSVTLR